MRTITKRKTPRLKRALSKPHPRSQQVLQQKSDSSLGCCRSGTCQRLLLKSKCWNWFISRFEQLVAFCVFYCHGLARARLWFMISSPDTCSLFSSLLLSCASSAHSCSRIACSSVASCLGHKLFLTCCTLLVCSLSFGWETCSSRCYHGSLVSC
jgi:hypothetical protein